MSKRRTGCWGVSHERSGTWHSTGQGSGGTQDDQGQEGDDADEDEFEEDDDPVRKANHEAKKHRLQKKQWRNRALAAEAKLAENGDESGGSSVDQSELVLSLVEAGMSRDRIRAAVKLIDWDSIEDVDDAIDQLQEDHAFLFSSPGEQSKDGGKLPGTGAKHNGPRNKGGPPNDQQIIEKYAALRHARGRSR